MECEPRGFQGWASIVRERTAHGRTVAPHDFGFRVAASCEPPCNGAYPPHTLLQCFLGMAVGFIHGLRRLTEIMGVTRWGGTAGNTSATAPRMDHWPSAMMPTIGTRTG